ncbi:MAG: AMP-binding protein [Chloroflexia bacterium]|nr:AMP-binding protein [Chloroflexia bacterium]
MDNDEIVWRPSELYLKRSRLRRFIETLGLADIEALQRRAASDPNWYWDAVVRDLGLVWTRRYDRVLDTSSGPAWAEWFPSAGFNYVTSAVDQHALGARRAPPALIWEGDDGAKAALTYHELAAEVNKVANALRALDIGPGDRVGIFLPMLLETAIATLACGKIGAIFVPLFSGFGAEAVASRLRDCDARLLITADGFYRRGAIVDLKGIADRALLDVPSVERCLVVRRVGAEVPWNVERDRWWHEAIAGEAATADTADTAANDPYMILYTSGTTGRPKGAVHVQAGFPIKAAHDLSYCFDLHPEDRLFWLTDLGWMMGPWAIAGGLLLGASILLFEGTPDFPEPDRLWRLVETHQVSVLGLAPTAIRSLMVHGSSWVRKHNLSSLVVLGSTGETWNPGPWRWYFDEIGGGRCPVINYSGGTETGGGIVGCTTIQPQKPCAFSGAVPGMDADVVDEAGASIRGGVGELIVRQPWVGMTRGFWRDPERYIETYWSRFTGVWVHGDWAEIDDDGFWFIRGRSDDTLKVAGKRVGPAEVESAAVGHPAVREAAAIGVPHPVKGESIAVFAILKPGQESTEALAEAVRQEIGRQLGAAFRPETVRFVRELPKTRNAKIMRRLIRAAYVGLPMGDLTALENPGAVAEIEALRPV